MNYFLIKQHDNDRHNKYHFQCSSEAINNNSNNNQNALNTMILDALSYQNKDIISVDLNSIRKIKHNRDRILSFNSKPSINNNHSQGIGIVNVIQQSLLNQVNTIIEAEYFNQQNKNEEMLMRRIPTTPYKILDAPKLIDDYYLNLIDWGRQNIIAVSLQNYVYLWNNETMKTATLCEERECICSVKWMENGTCLAVGLNDGSCDLYDVEKMELIRKMDGHSKRVSCLDWNNYNLTSGSKDSTIINHDVRVSNHIASILHSHSKEVCSLKWSIDRRLIASGGNDNAISIWDINKTQQPKIDLFHMSVEEEDSLNITNEEISPIFKLNYHKAAVRALAWCPYQRHVLASGGGVKDQSIKLWNCDSGILIKSTHTGSQVCSLLWNPHETELISSHGYSKNQIVIWNYSKMTRICELTAHKNRVLYLSLSPNGCSLVSGSGDESICFWSINDEKELESKKTSNNDQFKQNISTQNTLNGIHLR